jgi:integrase
MAYALMPIAALSPAFVISASCPATRRKIDFFDRSQKGFLLEVRQSGGKTYYQRFTDGKGRERQFKIGPTDALTLSQARRKGRQVVAEVLLGADPQIRRKQQRLIPRFEQFVREQYLPFIKSSKETWKTDETILRIHILPALGRSTLDEISTQNVLQLINQLREKGYAPGTMNRVLVIIRYIFNLARKWKVPGALENPASGLSAGPDAQKNRFLTEIETHRLVRSLEQDENQIAARAILLLLLTGARRNEITHAKWTHFEPVSRTLLVPKAKSGKPRRIALNGAAISLLSSWERKGEYIFPSPLTGRPPASLWFPWDRIRKRADLQELRLHDLRHSFASFLVNRGLSLYVVQHLLGHAHARTTERYAHLAPQTLTEAAEVVANLIPIDKFSSRT